MMHSICSKVRSLLDPLARNVTGQGWTIYHMVQPYFFAHHHFHIRKVNMLRSDGIPAWVLSFVPEDLYLEHRERYQKVVSEGLTKIIRVPRQATTNKAVYMFVVRELIYNKSLLLHALRVDPSPLIRMRNIPFIGEKIRYVLEYEGDTPSEFVYQSDYIEDPRPPTFPKPALQRAYQEMLRSQCYHIQHADGVVLMSQEHIELWERRIGRQLRTFCLPTLADPRRVYFSEQKRYDMRTSLGISDNIAIIYTGNVICKWQRFDAMCRFIIQLAQRISNLWFIALVRLDDLQLAKDTISRHGLDCCSTIRHVNADMIMDYLSAADIALFLRHNHLMNVVVTSGKLCEYLAAGLPVITTGANAQIINDFILERRAGIFLHDSLPVNDQIISGISELVARSRQSGWRDDLSQRSACRFGGDNDPYRAYVSFMRDIVHS